MELLTEKYRPTKRDELVGNKETIDRIWTMVENKDIPHLMFSGPAGSGKTTLALLIAKTLFKDNFRNNFLELNASDERKIDDVRNIIKPFSKVSPLEFEFKIILLDEVDSMWSEAQQALRRIMEKSSKVTRFILCCNKESGVIDPIVSRCQVFRFSPIKPEEVLERLKTIAKAEGLNASEQGLKEIANDSRGDMRNAINWLQVLSNSNLPVTPEAYQQKKKYDLPEVVWESLKLGRFVQARKEVLEYLNLGYEEREIIDILHKSLLNKKDIKYYTRGELIIQLAETDYRLTLGTSKGIQLDALLLKMINVFKEEKNILDDGEK